MIRTNRRRGALKQALLVVLASLHALVAGLGEGLHGLAHAIGGDCGAHVCPSHAGHDAAVVRKRSSDAAAESSPKCPCASHAHAESPRADAAARSRLQARIAPELGSQADIDVFGPDRHDCLVCQLLAQLAQSGGATETEVQTTSLVISPTLYSDASIRRLSRGVLSARGPPLLA